MKHWGEVTVGNGPQTRCSLCIEIVLVYIISISSLVDSMTKAWAHMAYLGNDPRKYRIGGKAGNLYK